MNLRDLPGLSPAADAMPPPRLSKSEAVARVLVQAIAILGISFTLGFVFLLLPVLLMFGGIFRPSHDAWPELLPVLAGLLLLLVGCVGLLLFRRWGAVLVGGLGWAWLVYVCYVKAATVGPTLFFDPAMPVLTALLVGLPLVTTLFLTVSLIADGQCWKKGR